MLKKPKKDLKIKVKPKMMVLNKILEGNWNTIFKGGGLEFAGYSKYTYADDAHKIDWRASLRSNELFMKEFEEYHSVNVFFLLDASNSMLCSSTGQLKSDYARELIYSLCYTIMQSDDAVGMGLFTDKLISNIVPKKNKDVYFKIIKELTSNKKEGGGFDLSKVLNIVNSFLEEGTILMIVSDFIGLKKGWHRYIKMLSRKYDVIGIMVRDPIDYEMPKSAGQYVVEDPYSNEKIYIDSRQYAKVYAKKVEEEEEFIKESFEKSNMGFINLRTNQDFQQPIIDYFKKRLKVMG